MFQPMLQVSRISSRKKATSLKFLQFQRSRGARGHYCMKRIVQGCRVLVRPLVLQCTNNTRHVEDPINYETVLDALTVQRMRVSSNLVPGIGSVSWAN